MQSFAKIIPFSQNVPSNPGMHEHFKTELLPDAVSSKFVIQAPLFLQGLETLQIS
jgi:hypothetical protein